MDTSALRRYAEPLRPHVARARSLLNRLADEFVDRDRPSDTRRRVYSGFAAGFGFIFCLYVLPGIWFLSLATLGVALLGVYEFGRLIRQTNHDVFFGPATAMGIAVLLWLAATRRGGVAYFGWILWFGMVMLQTVAFWYARSSLVAARVALHLLGVVWVALPLFLLLNTYVEYYSASGLPYFAPGLILYFLGMMWANDTAAYFVGRRWGRRPLAPRISPKKTIEGFAGGLGASLLAAMLLPRLLPQVHGLFADAGISASMLGVLGVLLGIVGPFGDLAESALKREAGVKDSGTFLPGHGGVLDRVDSFLFAAPIFVGFCWVALPFHDVRPLLP